MLSKREEKHLVKLVNKIGNVSQGLPQLIFEALCKVVIFPSCEVVVANEKKEVLMTFRSDEFWHGWHFPGRLIRYGQTFKQCLTQVVKTELGCQLKLFKFLFPLDYAKGLRGPGIGLVFLCQVQGRPKNGKFFKVMPKNIIFEHKELWKELEKFLRK